MSVVNVQSTFINFESNLNLENLDLFCLELQIENTKPYRKKELGFALKISILKT